MKVMKHWESVFEPREGRLKKWHWLLPLTILQGLHSYWHCLSVLETSPNLLMKPLVFSGKTALCSSKCFFLPKEEEGQCLIHLECRKSAFRLQFLHSSMHGDQNILWRQVTK